MCPSTCRHSTSSLSKKHSGSLLALPAVSSDPSEQEPTGFREQFSTSVLRRREREEGSGPPNSRSMKISCLTWLPPWPLLLLPFTARLYRKKCSFGQCLNMQRIVVLSGKVSIFSLKVDMGNKLPWAKSGKIKCPFLWNSSVMLHPLSCLIKMERTFLYVCPILPFIRIGIDCAFPLNLDNEMSFIFIYGLHKSVSLAAFHAPVPHCCVGISHPARQLNQKLMEKNFFLYKTL